MDQKDKALLDAARNGRLSRVMDCLDEGANIEAKNTRGYTPLHQAAWKGHIDVVQYLVLQKGARLDSTDNWKQTPLVISVRDYKHDVMRFLIDQGADVSAKTKRGKTALLRAIEYGNKIAIDCLLEKGADINVKDNEGKNALIYAVESTRPELVKFFIGKGLDIYDTDSRGRNAISYARDNDYREIVDFLNVVVEHKQLDGLINSEENAERITF